MKRTLDTFAVPSPQVDSRYAEQPQLPQPQPQGSLSIIGPYALWVAVMSSLALNFYMLADQRADRQIQLLQQQVQALEEATLIQQQSLNHHERLLVSHHTEQLEDIFEHRSAPDNTVVFSQMLQGQEDDLQKLMGTLKESMRDVANMIPGPRNWVNDYAEQLDEVARSSRNRNQALREWCVHKR